MADMSKAEKLAAARKKLREFQHNKEGGTTTNTSRSTPERRELKNEVPIADSFKTIDGDAYISFQQSICIDNNNSHETSHVDKLDQFNESFKNRFPNQIDILSPVPLQENVSNSNNIATSTPNTIAVAPTPSETTITEEMVTSTSETLRQLAMQMNGLIGHEHDSTGSPTMIAENSLDLTNNADKNELLVRNQQLAAQLAEREQAVAHLQASFTQLQKIASNREDELKHVLAEVEQKWTGECAALREQLQLHTQTVGILVAEKTEAQSALSRAQASAKAKAAEAEEAQGRLRASRHKLSELESSLAAIKSGQEQQNEHLNATTSELERLKEELRVTEIQRNESKDEASQLQQRLHASNQHVATLQAELQERHSQLSIAQVRLQQLGGSVPGGVEVSEAQAELQAEHERRVALEQEVAELRSASAEKEQTSQQYQQFIEQLNAQLTSLASKLQESTKENENLSDRQQNLIKHIGELESRLQHTPAPKTGPTTEEIAERDQMQQDLAELKNCKQSLQEKLEIQESETAKLKLQLVQAEERVMELQEGRPDEARLLAVMESDKVAAARATAQNAQLKQQLLEQQHVHAQLIDQLRHHEARLQNAEKLQQDLLQAQEQINVLTIENERLKTDPKTATEAEDNNKVPSVGSLTPEAAERLQDRFAQTMRQLAETSDEKQRLEHLVMQLQGETETIGEYVALYQQQRGLLQQRAAEKDKEMERMAAERELLKQKLQKVGHLVSDLVVCVPDAENKDAETDLQQAKPASNAVAEQISALLSEICDSESLAAPVVNKECVQHNEKHHSTDTMLPCPLCSGRLEVV